MFLYGNPLDGALEFAALIKSALFERSIAIIESNVPAPLVPLVGPMMMQDAQSDIAGATFTVESVRDCDGNSDTLACERCGALDVEWSVEWGDDARTPEDFRAMLTQPNLTRVPINAIA